MCWVKILHCLRRVGYCDMLIYKYLKAIFLKKTKFYLNNYGNHTRDFTYMMMLQKFCTNLNVKILVSNSVNICSNNSIRITRILEFINKYFKRNQNILKELSKSR